jgi:hypothetical protein
MCYGENGTVKFVETVADNVFRHDAYLKKIKRWENSRVTQVYTLKQCRSLKFLNKDNKFVLLFSYVKKRSFQMCAHADVLIQENYSYTMIFNIFLSFFFRLTLCCLSFDLRILTTVLVSSNSSNLSDECYVFIIGDL